LDSSFDATDLITPYGYGGPFGWNVSAAVETAFWSTFSEWAKQQHVVSEFVRLSLFPKSQILYPGTIRVTQPNVVRHLDLNEIQLWFDVEHKVRKNVKKGRSLGIDVQVDHSGHSFESFIEVYESTLNRRDADQRYFFDRSFYHELHASLSGHFAYFHARLNDQVVSSELVLVSAEHVYSFLGGTLAEAFSSRPNDLLKYEIIRWARQEGKRTFVLGGGYRPLDGIFNYKKSFAPSGTVPFRVGHRVFDTECYDQLVAARSRQSLMTGAQWNPAPDHFPAYRA